VRGGALVALLLLLLAMFQVSSPQGALHVVWRVAVLSFDDPATQILDQIALEKPSFADGLGQAIRTSRLAATAPCGIAVPPVPLAARRCVLGQFVGRSPPIG
jgi:hypothetical protein